MRYYGSWAGNPKGIKEDPSRCIAEVACEFCRFAQCGRKRGHGPDGLYCKQHATMLSRGKTLWVPKDEEE